jgi:hypothetical protein
MRARLICCFLAGLLAACAARAEDPLAPGLVNTFYLDSNAPFILTLQANGAFDLTAPDGRKASGTYVVGAAKLGLLKDNVLRHFEYKVENGNLLLRPTATDGPEKGDALGEMPPAGQVADFTTFLSPPNWQFRRPVAPAAGPAAPGAGDPVAALLEQARADSAYYDYLAVGAKALAERNFTQARANFVLASRLRPDSAEARERLAAAEGLELLQQADAARQWGDRPRAKDLYEAAARACPALRPAAQARAAELGGGAPPPPPPLTVITTGGADAGIVQRLRAGQTADALRLAVDAWRNNPNSLKLRLQKEGIESLQTCEAIYQGVANILARGQGVCDEARKAAALEDEARRVRAQLQEKSQAASQRLTAARARLLGEPFAGAGNTLFEARATAREAADLLAQARDTYRKKADELLKESQVDLGVVTIKLDKENKRARQLAGFADSFGGLSNEAAALAR